MKIYAIRDRLLDYFQTPFAAHNDKEVLASLANTVNHPETTNAIAQAPHHFEIWQLGEVDEDGHISSKIDFLADASSLVRRSVRDPEGRTSGGDRPEGAANASRSQPSGDRTGAGTPARAVPNAPPAARIEATETHRQPPRGDQQPNR